ncbi:la protein homolog [Lepeophtheirus salmonis]|uniref:La protein homolog n=1 Tax=Lepeophtheirus salmonis TaxID=72036 RepID=C1BTF1_LEPSM|nr:la protein homolog [Lepeophtheirus salmonis]ACO12304.1 La protein homolog [Lepeophtheirus salmonis]
MVEMDKVKAKIVRQVDYYFGDFNLSRDKFLKEKIKECEGGWIDMDIMLKFQRLSALASGDAALVLKALKEAGGDLVEVDEEKSRIRRNPSLEIPEITDELKEKRQAATIYVKGFDKENTETAELLEFFESIVKNIVSVEQRRWIDKKDNTKGFKGSVLVFFKSKEDAQVLMDMEDLKYKDLPLIKKWQSDYWEEKKKEIEERRKKKTQKKEPKETKAAETQTFSLPKGSVLIMDCLNEKTSREDLKEALKENFGVNTEDIAFIYYERGQKTAKLRFKNENGAKDVHEKIVASDEKEFKVQDDKVEFKLLEGEEEESFLKKCVEDMQQMRSKPKRRKGFGGRGGGKRQRMG